MPGSVRNFKKQHFSKDSSEQIYIESHQDVNLYVSGLPCEISPNALRNLFESCGSVTRVKLLPLKGEEFATRAGFVCYATMEEAEKARTELKGFKLGDYQIAIQHPRSKQPYYSGGQAKNQSYQDLLSKLEEGPLCDSDTSLLLKTQQRNSHEVTTKTNFSSGRGKAFNREMKRRIPGERVQGGYQQQSSNAECEDKLPLSTTSKNMSFGHGSTAKHSQVSRNDITGHDDEVGSPLFQKSFDSMGDRLNMQKGSKKNSVYPNQKNASEKFDKDSSSSRSTSRPPHESFPNDSAKSFEKKPFHELNKGEFGHNHRVNNETTQQQRNNFETPFKNPSMLSHSPCRICGKMTQTFCSLCSVVHYCSEECQSKDWPEHSKICGQLAKNDFDVESGFRKPASNEKPFHSDERKFINDAKFQKSTVNNRPFNSINSQRPFTKSPPRSHQKRSPPSSKVLKQPLISTPPVRKPCIAHVPQSIKPSVDFEVLVTDINAENASFICQIADENLILSLNKQQEELNAHFMSNIGRSLTKPSIGDFCAAKFSEDNNWYRAEVQAFCTNDKVQVQFIDYGNSEVIHKLELKQLTPAFCKAPAYCLTCKLAQTGVEKWSQEQMEFLAEILRENEMLLGAKCFKITDDVIYAHFKGGKIDINQKIAGMEKSEAKIDVTIDVISNHSASQNLPSPSKHEPKMKMPLASESELSESPLDVDEAVRIYELSDIASLKLPISEFDVTVSFVNDPNFFYCQIISDDLVRLQEFLQQLAEHCRATNAPEMIQFKPGNICCALFDEDKLWYRAEILEELDSNSFKVFYFDFGNTADVSASYLRILPEDFMNLPIQSFKASLANCLPLKGENWTKDAIESFKSVINSPLKAKVITKSNEIPQIILLVDADLSVSDQLVANGHAVKALPQMSTAATSEPPPQPKVQSSPMQTATSSKKPSMTLEYFKPELDCRLKISITCLNEDGSFHCHVVRPELEALSENISELTLYANKAPQLLPSVPTPGTYCAAYFDEEQTWYRGVVEKVTGDHVQVKYVDYGNSTNLSRTEIKLLRNEFKDLPIQAVPCSLANVQPFDGSNWSKEYNELLLEYVGKELDAKFSEKEGLVYRVVIPELVNKLIEHKIGQFCF